jgi:hypothetical protein
VVRISIRKVPHLGRSAPRCGQHLYSSTILGTRARSVKAPLPPVALGPRREDRGLRNQNSIEEKYMNRADPTTAESNFLGTADREISVEEVAEIQALDATMYLSTGVVVLASHAKSFQFALDQEFAKGVETSDESSST